MLRLTCLYSIAVVCCLASFASNATVAGTLKDGVLIVDGKPFFPLGGWDEEETTPEDIARLGMNTSFRHGAPVNPEMEVKFRAMMRKSAQHGIQVLPYISYGGHGVHPWPEKNLRYVSKIGDEPNLLAWYVGDDIAERHLEGLRNMVNVLREKSPHIPMVADYIGKPTPEAKSVFRNYVDIRSNYDYPLPTHTFRGHQHFFERERSFVGDPLWTWVQCFMWGRTGRDQGVQPEEGPSPIPDAEQVRLLSFAAVNRGVRGLLYFSHREIQRLPAVQSMVALTCRELRLFEPYLAAGTNTYKLNSSHPDIDATAFAYEGSVLLSAALFKETYYRWVDRGIVENVSIECPWPDESPLPEALLVDTPAVVNCKVERIAKTGTVRVTIPSLELAGLVLLTADAKKAHQLRAGVAAIPDTMATLASPGAVAQTQKVANLIWTLGFDPGGRSPEILAMMRASEACAAATAKGETTEAVLAWKDSMRRARVLLDGVMHKAEARRYNLPLKYQPFLVSPWGLHSIPGLRDVPEKTPWHVVRQWEIAGPFPLHWDGKDNPENIPAGFLHAYAPEGVYQSRAKFKTVDGTAGWKTAKTDLSGMLNFMSKFTSTQNMVGYARCNIVAPRDMEATLSLGSNDGANLWVNGESVYKRHEGRWGMPHQEKIPVKLKAGENPVLVKVENLQGGWRLYLSVHDEKRELTINSGAAVQ